jgi:hypothetical protein
LRWSERDERTREPIEGHQIGCRECERTYALESGSLRLSA